MPNCGEQGAIWSDNMGNMGACTACHPPVPMSQQNKGRWVCGGPDIQLNKAASLGSKACMSWTTKDTCAFRQKDLAALQVRLQSSGCNGIWAAPLWMVGDTWHQPQHATGEIDIFERGCSRDDGYVISFGEGGKYVLRNAWGQQGTPTVPSDFVAFMEFDPQNDKVSIYKCDSDANPIKDGVAQKCGAPTVYSGYYADSSAQTHGNTDYMHFVSDVWNACPTGCSTGATSDSDCNFKISGLQLRFAEGTGDNPFRNQNPICKALIAGEGPSPPPSSAAAGELCGSDAQGRTCDPAYPTLKCTPGADGKNRCACSGSFVPCGPMKSCSPPK